MSSDSTEPLRPKIRLGYRSRHRADAHADAHSGASQPEPEAFDHALSPAGEPEWIETAEGLDDLIAHLRSAGTFAFDTEFIGEHTYYPQLCVIQAATPARLALVDALADLDLTAFWELVADAGVRKLVHAGRQDLEPVWRLLGQEPANVFDTQIAAAFTIEPRESGEEEAGSAASDGQEPDPPRWSAMRYPISLDALIRDIAGADPGRGSKFSQWDRRPLTAIQRSYAAKDVRYGPLLEARLVERLEAVGNLAWAREESERALCDRSLYEFDPDALKLRAKAGPLRRRPQAIARSLLLWREQTAQHQDATPRAVLPDLAIHTMAESPPESARDLEVVRGVPRPVREAYGDAILEAVARGQEAELPPRRPRPQNPKLHDEAVRAVWDRVVELALPRHIDPTIVTSKRELDGCIHRGLFDPPSDSRLRVGWRAELLAKML